MADEPAANPSPTPSGTPAAPSPAADASAALAATPPADPTPPAANPNPTPPAAPVIPEKYDFKAVKLPEGVKLDEPLLKDMEPVFKELGLSQENASKLVEMHAKTMAALETQKEADFKTWMADQVKQHQATLRKEWGQEFDANLAVAQRGMARVASPAMKALLDETGLGNHPEFVKAFLAVGKMVSEDTPPATHTAAVRKSLEDRLYPNMPRSN
jgi:hypothetical protein